MKKYLITLSLAIAVLFPAIAQEDTSALKQEIKTTVGVNDADAEKLANIATNYKVEKEKIQLTLKADPTLRAEKLKELNDKTNVKVRDVLNDQQFKKFLMILLKQ